MHIDEFIEKTNNAETAEEIFALFRKATAAFGYDRLLYSALSAPDGSRPQTPGILANYDHDWMDHYVRAGYVENDPVRLTGLATGRPFTWQEVEQAQRHPKKYLRIFPEARSAGLHDGVGLPFHGPRGEVYGVGMASSLGGTDPEVHLRRLFILGVQFHTAYSAHFAAPDPRPPVRLTGREREILTWARAGKSNGDIGDILNLSEHTVRWHLAHVYEKLATSSRITAVVRAISLGLISE